jgi:hypothetical protein
MSDTPVGVPERIVQYTGGRNEFGQEGVTKIEGMTFERCLNLQSLAGMSESDVTELGDYCFLECRALKLLVGFPKGVQDRRVYFLPVWSRVFEGAP